MARATIGALRAEAASCRNCDLYKDATQTVFGEGPSKARVVMVGEQPGDKEDVEGRPFVGPAGRILDRALTEAGIDRKLVYVTNAVKHFRFERRGKRRIHEKPNAFQITACKPWLEAELMAVRPRAVVALGATAARSLLGAPVKVTAVRGERLPSDLAEVVIATVHPSSILRSRDDAARHEAFEAFVRDLRTVARALQRSA